MKVWGNDIIIQINTKSARDYYLSLLGLLGFLPTEVYILDVNACHFVKHIQFYSCFFVPYEYEYRVTFKENRQSYITLL